MRVFFSGSNLDKKKTVSGITRLICDSIVGKRKKKVDFQDEWTNFSFLFRAQANTSEGDRRNTVRINEESGLCVMAEEWILSSVCVK